MGRKKKNTQKDVVSSGASSIRTSSLQTTLPFHARGLGTLRELDEIAEERDAQIRPAVPNASASDLGLPSVTEIRSSSEQRTVLDRLANIQNVLADLTPSGASRERERLVSVVTGLEARVFAAQNAFRASVDKTLRFYDDQNKVLERKIHEIQKPLADE